ncbi:hypothetical protein OH492_26745 [Vibrio chagasii]|nr:hypothetical protein [Vibrio chagasii]
MNVSLRLKMPLNYVYNNPTWFGFETPAPPVLNKPPVTQRLGDNALRMRPDRIISLVSVA